jgi:hypothetical protein
MYHLSRMTKCCWISPSYQVTFALGIGVSCITHLKLLDILLPVSYNIKLHVILSGYCGGGMYME